MKRLLFSMVMLSAALGSAAGREGDVLTPLDVRQVQVGGEIGRRMAVTVTNNLLVLDADKDFLAPFQKRNAKDGYVGLGKLIDSMVRLAANTGNEQLLVLKRHVVAETIKTQEPDGYIGLLKPEARMTGLWDIHEMGYLVYGLLSDYRFFQEEPSLVAARKLADYILQHWDRLPADWDTQTTIATHVSVTGLERTLLTLAVVTGDARYRDFVIQTRALPEWQLAIVIGRRVGIEGHVYAYMARSLAQLELFRSLPDKRLLGPARQALRFMTGGNGMTISGGVGQCEIWTADQDGRGDLGESCATAYQLRVYDNLLRLGGESVYGDLMERTIYNALFAAQSPDGRKIRYYTPFEGLRVYHPGDTFCCPCNFRRIIAELPQMICYRATGGIAINLYTPSEAKMELDDHVSVSVRQETAYPSDGKVLIHVEPAQPAKFSLQLRIPRWCTAARVAVNGEAVSAPRAGIFLTIKRQWRSGDQVELNFPMPWRFVAGRQRQAGRVALMRGPLVYGLNPAQNAKLAKLDAGDLGRLVLVPASLEAVQPDTTVRPAGTACRLKASSERFSMGNRGDMELVFTEFADPAMQCIYFRVPDLKAAVADELTGNDLLDF